MSGPTRPRFAVRPTSWRVLSVVLLGLLKAPAFGDEISLRQLSGPRIDADWFRYMNSRFGVAVDIPNMYYERLTISSNCSALFNSLRIFYPQALERSFDALVTRMSLSLRATCLGEEGAAKFD